MKTKRNLIQLGLLPAVLLALPAAAQVEYGYSVIGGATVTITGYGGTNTVVAIPNLLNVGSDASPDFLPVTAIGQLAFGSSSITSIAIPDSVTTIGAAAFQACYSLTNVVLPNAITTLENGVFEGCTNLVKVTIPSSVISIKDSAFAACFSLPSITIPNSVTNIGQAAFAQCDSLTNITIPNSVTSLGFGAFQLCSSLKSVTIGSGITTITNGNEFAYCSSLTNVVLPNSLTSIGLGAFQFCTNLSTITIPNGVTSIGEDAFYASGLTSITIPNSVTNLGSGAFGSCGSLIHVTLPNSITSIGEAFTYCTNLTSITIPNSVTNIASDAFYDCPNLVSVYFQGNAPTPTFDTSVFALIYGQSIATAYYLPGTTGWSDLYDGLQTVLWNPQAQTSGGSFGMQNNQFGFDITGSSNLVIVVEASTNLAGSTWIPVGTNTLNVFIGTNGTSYFSDPQWTNYRARFYRLRSP